MEKAKFHTSLHKGYNAFTEECDKYLIKGYAKAAKEFNARTYLHKGGDLENGTDGKQFVVFRVPGASRGALIVDSGQIVDIKFNDDTCFDYKKGVGCFHKKVVEATKKFIGTQYVVDVIK